VNDIDQQIAEFHAAGRKRKAWIFGISGALMLALGIVLLVVCFTLGGEDELGRSRYPIKIIIGGIAFVLGGISSLYNAYRVGSGQVNDVDSDVGRDL
jgi:O-antigen/teichoic acid export membrane protein